MSLIVSLIEKHVTPYNYNFSKQEISSHHERLTQVDAAYRHVRVTFPRPHNRLERVYLGIRAGLVAIQPHARVTFAVVLHLASVRALTPSAVVLGRQGQAHPAVVGHVPTPVYHQMDVVRVVQRFRAAPDHRERHGDVGRSGRVGKLCLLAVNRVREQPSVHDRHTTFYVELTDEPGLHDELLEKISFAQMLARRFSRDSVFSFLSAWRKAG